MAFPSGDQRGEPEPAAFKEVSCAWFVPSLLQVQISSFPERSDAKVIRYPDRYEDERGKTMWEEVWNIVAELGAAGTRAADPDDNVVALNEGASSAVPPSTLVQEAA